LQVPILDHSFKTFFNLPNMLIRQNYEYLGKLLFKRFEHRKKIYRKPINFKVTYTTTLQYIILNALHYLILNLSNIYIFLIN